jgi:hypothetical protein
MENKYNKVNNESRKRLQKLVNEITDEELKLVMYQEGWTIAAALGHLAFWDERRALNLIEWLKNGFKPSGINDVDTRMINDALLPFLLALPVRKAAGLAVSCAEKVDKVIEGLSIEVVRKIEEMGDEYALDRNLHRKMHLDEIDKLLKTKRGKG